MGFMTALKMFVAPIRFAHKVRGVFYVSGTAISAVMVDGFAGVKWNVPNKKQISMRGLSGMSLFIYFLIWITQKLSQLPAPPDPEVDTTPSHDRHLPPQKNILQD